MGSACCLYFSFCGINIAVGVKDEIDEAVQKYWEDWHSGLDDDIMPEKPNPSFEKGFMSCLSWVKEKGLITLDVPLNARRNNARKGE